MSARSYESVASIYKFCCIESVPMSACVEYLQLHHLYVQSLQHWGETTLVQKRYEVELAQKQRDLAFAQLSLHREQCRQCENGTKKNSHIC
jgi:hypothetical protein